MVPLKINGNRKIRVLQSLGADYVGETGSLLAHLDVPKTSKALHREYSFPFWISPLNDQIRSWSHLLKKSLMKNFIFCAVKYENIPFII